MDKKAMMFSSGTRPKRGDSITLFPDPKNLGTMEVISVKWWDAHGNWIMVARDSSGQSHSIKNKDFQFWTKEKATESNPKEYLLKKPRSEPARPIDIRDFEEGLSQTSAWLSRNCKFSILDQTPSRPAQKQRR